mmetsp:Transcript_6565/g.8620  ORF Transcript_6565/g.8620 Transcript_6565/m.8620 type:complete len:107 (+) Transcript_6565:1018-1338(+)
MPLENSEPTDFTTVTHCPDPSDVLQSYDFEESNESSCPESERIAVESSHDGARFLSRNATDDQELVAATLIDRVLMIILRIMNASRSRFHFSHCIFVMFDINMQNF